MCIWLEFNRASHVRAKIFSGVTNSDVANNNRM